MAAIVAGLIASFLLFGFWWPYWRVADMDFWMTYEAWLHNDGLPQEWFDHPGYFTIYLLGGWFRLLHHAGLLEVNALSGVPAPQDAGDAWTAAVRAGRVLHLLIAITYVLVFAWLLRRVVKDWRIVVLASFVLTFSGGLAMSARIMRTELVAGGAVTVGLLLLIIAARAPASNWRPVLVGLAASCAVLGHINKIQVIYLVCALPLIVFPFGVDSKEAITFWRTSPRAKLVLVALGLCALLAAAAALPLVGTGLAQAPLVPGWRPFLFNTYGAYQGILALWTVISIVAFATWWRVSAVETAATLACVVIGASIALLLLYLRYHPQNSVVVINPLEQLMSWAGESTSQAGMIGIAKALLEGLHTVLRTRTFILDTSARPTIFLEWLVLAGSFFAWRAGHRKMVLQIAMLLGAGWGMDTISAIRGLKQQYFILTDPLVIISASLLLAQLPVLQMHRWAFPIGIALLAAHVTISQAEPIKHTFLKSKPMDFCVKNFGYTKRIEHFPFCPAT